MQKDKKHGYGIQYYPSGAIFYGQFKDGKRHGMGLMKYSKDVEFDGEWIEGKRGSKGLFKISNKKIGTSYLSFEEEEDDVEVKEEFENL